MIHIITQQTAMPAQTDLGKAAFGSASLEQRHLRHAKKGGNERNEGRGSSSAPTM